MLETISKAHSWPGGPHVPSQGPEEPGGVCLGRGGRAPLTPLQGSLALCAQRLLKTLQRNVYHLSLYNWDTEAL